MPGGHRKVELPSWLRMFSQESFFGMFLSIVPGFAHIIQRRFAEIRLYVIIWCFLLCGSVFFYGGILGWPLLGLTVAMHAWIAIHSGFLKEFAGFRYRLLGLLLVGLGLFVIYRTAANLIFRDFTGGYTSVRIPYHHIRERDFLLARRSLADPENLTRGSLVLTGVGSVGNRFVRRYGEQNVIAQIIALPGETLEIRQGAFVVEGITLDPNQCPVPRWLKSREFSVTIGLDRYFVSAEFQGQGYNASHVMSVCIVSLSQIQAKAFMRWSPLFRRGFIKEIE